ncbi:hypothetical protein ACFL1D_04260 [Candidatus Omnitrophota bacterium]
MRNKHTRGLTLAELLLAAAIMAFVICGLIALFVNCSFLNEGNRNLTMALSHAQYIMEEIRNEGDLDQIKTMIDNQSFTGLSGLSSESISVCCYDMPWANPASSCLESCITDGGNPLGVYVSVSWQDRRQRTRQVALHTLMTDYQ